MYAIRSYYVILLLIAFGQVSFPAGTEAGKISMEKFEVDGYEIDVSVQQKDGNILIRGRISYGPYCVV